MNKKNSKIGILGYGEVGRAIAKFYKNPRIKDLDKKNDLKGVEVLNVCIPWNKRFISVVTREIKQAQPRLTIIHSTVPPFTIQEIASKLPERFKNVVHSPIRGIHPHLYKGIKTFVKYIGAETEKSGSLAQKHLKKLGIKTRVFRPAVTTEIGKLLSTSYYGLCIAWHGEMKKMCDKVGVDFKKAVTDFNETYNEGYKKLGKKNVVRPILYPPESGIGGHCICQNAEILKKYFNNKGSKFILNYDSKKKK